MDTVSSAWSVVTTAYTVIDFFVSVASAGEDCRQLVRELYTATRMIDSIRILAKENPEKLEQLNTLLVPNGGLDQFRHTVDELSSRILQSKGIKEGYKRVKFVLRHQTMQELLQDIQRQQIPFIACLGAENTKLLLEVTAKLSILSSEMHHLTAQASSNGNTSHGIVPSKISHPFLVPFSQDTHSLVVRDAYQNIIESKFENCTRLTLYGLGGSGKSRLAIEFAYRHKASCPVFWVYTGNDTTFRGSYSKIAQVVTPDFRREFDEDQANETNDQRRDVTSSKMKLATAWLESDKSGDWIMVLDNCDNQEMIHGQDNEPSILHQLPVPSRGKILATSRRKDLALSISGSENAVVHVEAFPPEEAVKCFRQLLPNDKASDDRILSLAQELGFLPLAIRQAAAYISSESASIEEYSSHLASSETSKMALLEKDFRDTMRADGVPNSVLRVWLVSFEQILRQNEEASKMLCFMATLDPSRIQDYILKEVWKDPLAFRANIGLVLAFSFVGVVGSRREAYTMHRLIHLSTQAWMKRRGEKADFSRMALSNILKLFEQATTTFTWADCQTLLPHARLLLATEFDDSELAVQKAKLRKLVENFENPPLWQLSSQQNSDAYRRLSTRDDLIDMFPTLASHTCFQDWLSGRQPLLVLNGGVGSGKTVACFSVIQTLQLRLDSNGSRPIVAYFFFSFTSAGKFDIVKALLLDIISQMCQQMGAADVPEFVRTLLSAPYEVRSRDDLIDTIRDLFGNTDQQTFVILDGLDECYDEYITEIIHVIPNLMVNTRKVSILISSRLNVPMAGLEGDLRPAILRLDNTNTSAATDEYILTRLQDSQVSSERKAFICQQVKSKSGGYVEGFSDLSHRAKRHYHIADSSPGSRNFLLINSVMQTMTQDLKNERDSFLKQLLSASTDLTTAMQSFLAKIAPAHREQVSVLLRWAAFAFRPMAECELSEILDIQGCPCPSEMEIAGMTTGLLFTDDVYSNYAQPLAFWLLLSHASVRDFFSTPNAGDFQLPHAEGAHKTLLDVCLEALVERGGGQSLDLRQHPFLHYAAEFWPKHLEEARKGDPLNVSFNDKTSGYLRRLFDAAAPAAFLCWLRLHDPAEPDLGVQLTKNLDNFRPMKFYLDMLNLHSLITGSQRKSVEGEQQEELQEQHQEEHQEERHEERHEKQQKDKSGGRSSAKYRILCCRPH